MKRWEQGKEATMVERLVVESASQKGRGLEKVLGNSLEHLLVRWVERKLGCKMGGMRGWPREFEREQNLAR